jgi:Ca-activated chloride channel homolog
MLRFANTELLESVAPQRPTRWRHLPAILLVASLLLFTVAMAGPTHDMRIPRNRAVVLLVIDVSQSMRATDISPSRLAAAQDAAKQFAGELTPGINLGLVAYAGTASVLVSPTTNHDATKRAIDTLRLTVSSMTKTSSAATPARLPRLPTADLKNACFAATGRSLPATTRIMTNPSVLGPPVKVRS